MKKIKNRISCILDESQLPEQAAYRKEISTVDHLHTSGQVLEKVNEYLQSMFIAFVDYGKAFDSINQSSAFKKHEKHGILAKTINNIKKICTNGTAQLRTEKPSEKIKIQKRLHLLFTAVIEEIF